MVKQSGSDQSGIRARQFPQAIRFLRATGVPATRLAGIFGTAADNIRHIDSRAYRPDISTAQSPTLTEDDRRLLRLSSEARTARVRRNLQGIRLRSITDWEQAEQSIWAIWQKHRSTQIRDGYEALRVLQPSTANALHGQALGVRLLLQERLGWFALNLNQIDDALNHAQDAMRLALMAFRESAGARGYLLRYSEAALVASVCLQKRQSPKASHDFIKAAIDANEAAGVIPGSEPFRQLGTALLQLTGHDDRAARAFRSAEARMKQKDEASHPVDLRMTGLRQRALLSPEDHWDDVQRMATEVGSVHGRTSMQFEVAARFTAAVGFKLNTSSTILASQQLLAALPDSPLAAILAIAPDLKLNTESLDRWLRFALYEVPVSRP